MILPHPISTLFPYTTLFRSFPKPCLRLAEFDKEKSRWLKAAHFSALHWVCLNKLFRNGLRTKLRNSALDRKSTRLNSSHRCISYAVFCLKKKKKTNTKKNKK